MNALVTVASYAATLARGVLLAPVLARGAVVGFALPVAGLAFAFGSGFSAGSESGGGPAKPEGKRCLRCGGQLAPDGWCANCQMSREAIEQLFREQRLEEARTPCGVLLVLALFWLLVLAACLVWLALLNLA
jgi:hypothetical protein